MNNERSTRLHSEAQRYIPGGVNSPARSWSAVGGGPLYIAAGAGSRIRDADGNEFIDYVCSWGPLILGHARAEVLSAMAAAAEKGTSFGAPTEAEVRLAQTVTEAFPSIDQVRLVNSGTEAGMSAIRLARAYTGRAKVIKFEGGYHGHADSLLVAAGSGAAAHGVPTSAGVTPAQAADTLVADYNHVNSVRAYFKAYPDDIACVIVEPIAGNMGVVPPAKGFLEDLREITSKYGALLLFDEVITGFRLTFGGAQNIYGVEPDVTCLGKIIGGGLPVGLYGASQEIMATVAPLGPMYQAGTLSGNPVAVAAGTRTLELLQGDGVYEGLEGKAAELQEGLTQAFRDAGVGVSINRVGSMMTLFFTPGEVAGWADVQRCDGAAYAAFFHKMIEEGIYFPPSPFEAMFVSTAHSATDIEQTVNAARRALARR